MSYEKRLLKFLQDNPKVRITARQIAGVWKRNKDDVQRTANILLNKRKIKENPIGELSLVYC